MSIVYITENNIRVQKKGNRLLVGRNLEVLLEIPEEVLEGMVLLNTVQLTSEVMVDLLKRNIPVTWVSAKGEFYGRLETTVDVNVFKHQKQFKVYGTKVALAWSKKNIAAKIANQVVLLRRYRRRQKDNIDKIDHRIFRMQLEKKKIEQCHNISEIMGYEGSAARNYFEALGMMLPPKFAFEKRTKQPPLDPFNSMLSMGYTLLLYEIYTALLNKGLHPYVGFTHSMKNHHPALASDLIEQWRPILIDSLAMGLVHHHMILPEHFTKSEENDGIYLNREGRRIFIMAYEKKMRTLNKYHSWEHTYRHSLSYQADNFSQALMAESAEAFEPLLIR